MQDFVLLIVFLALAAFGYYVMTRVDRFLNELRNPTAPFGPWRRPIWAKLSVRSWRNFH